MPKTTLVLIHGWGFDSKIWQPLLAELSKAYQVITLDLPGFNQLSSPVSKQLLENYSIDNIIAAIQPKLPPRAIYLGWSLGGLIAIRLAELLPQLVTSLILVASTPKFLATTNWPGISADFFTEFTTAIASSHKAVNQKITRLLANLQLPLDLTYRSKILQIRDKILCAQCFNPITPQQLAMRRVLTAALLLLRDTDYRENLAKLNCPIKIILGGADKLVPSAIADSYYNFLTNIQVTIINDAAHAVFYSHQAEFLAWVLATS